MARHDHESPAKEKKAPEPTPRDPLIKTVDEVAALTPEQQQAFRHAGGTTVENHVIKT